MTLEDRAREVEPFEDYVPPEEEEAPPPAEDPHTESVDQIPEDYEGRALVERISNIGSWEMFRLVWEDTGRPICSIALHPSGSASTIEYAVWRANDLEEPGTTGTVQRAAQQREWGEEAREDALRQLLYRYEDDLSIAQEQLTFDPIQEKAHVE